MDQPEMWTLLVDPIYLLKAELQLFLAMAALYPPYFASGDIFRRRRPAGG